MSFLEGFLAGLATIIFIGPVFFYLLKTSIDYGIRNGLLVAVGIIISDIIALALCYFGLGKFLALKESQMWLALAGGLIILSMGTWYIFSTHIKTEITKISLKNRMMFFVNGFLVNFINPFVFGVWIGLIALTNEKYEHITDRRIFLIAVILGIFCMDSSKVLLAKYLRPILDPSRLIKLYRIIGVVMVLFAGRLLWYALKLMLFPV